MTPVWRARTAGLALVAALCVAAGLSGCGKKGPPEAPGPGDKVTYPRSYPTQ